MHLLSHGNMELNKDFLKKAGIFALFVIGFWLISLMYMSPAMDGMMLNQGDMTQSRLMRADLDKYIEQTGHHANWAPNIFGGMPSNMIVGKPGGNMIYNTHFLTLFNLVGLPYDFLFLSMLSMFALLMASKVDKWLAAAGAIGYAFMTFSIISYEAGHITKVLAMALMPGVIAGFVLMFRRKYIYGTIVMALFFALQIGYNHYQITYYSGITLAIFVLVALVITIMDKLPRHGLLIAACSAIAGALAVGTNIAKIADTQEYAKGTMRGGSKIESTAEAGQAQATQVGKKGLNIDYAFSWSYMPRELFTLIVPRYMGGSSNEVYEYVDEFQTDTLPLYHGDLQFTSGPVYIGAVFMVLFLAAFVICYNYIKNADKNDPRLVEVKIIMAGAALTVLVSAILALGKYLGINTLLFEALPFYNKFRTPMMALAIAQSIVPFFSMYGLNLMFTQKNSSESLSFIKPLLITVGVILAVTFISIKTQEYGNPGDARNFGNAQGVDELVRVLKNVRQSAATSDFGRTFVFVLLAMGVIFMAAKRLISKNVAFISIALLCSIDLISVSKRYLGDENWVEKPEEQVPPPSNFDMQLMAVNKEKARVLDLRRDPFNDNSSVPYHRNIGGYHPAKLSDYQDVISYAITPQGANFNGENLLNNNALDMLNCKYVLTANPQSGANEVLPRNTALGTAWFVSKVETAATAKATLDKINITNVRSTAIVTQGDEMPSATSFAVDSAVARINQTYFSPDTVKYASNNPNAGLALFSEVYYKSKQGEWKAFVNGKETKVLKANYILRALELPAGSNTIEFVFVPQPNSLKSVELASSGIILLAFLASLFLRITGRKVKWMDA